MDLHTRSDEGCEPLFTEVRLSVHVNTVINTLRVSSLILIGDLRLAVAEVTVGPCTHKYRGPGRRKINFTNRVST